MKFLIDAQLPRRLSVWLQRQGYDAVHTSDLPSGNATPDRALIETADAEARFVVTKDDDFAQSYALNRRPARLLLVATGNIRNDELEALIVRNWGAIARALESSSFIEVSTLGLIVHE